MKLQGHGQVWRFSCVRYKILTVYWQETWLSEEVCIGVEQACVYFCSLQCKLCYKTFACVNSKIGTNLSHHLKGSQIWLLHWSVMSEPLWWVNPVGRDGAVLETQGLGWGLGMGQDWLGKCRLFLGFCLAVLGHARVMQEQWLSSKYFILPSILIFILIAIS